MQIYSVFSEEFRPYGKVIDGLNAGELLEAMSEIPLPESGTAYRPAIDSLEACDIFSELENRCFGGMPIQVGMCWGRNTKLNCLEYHRDSEINIGTEDFVLLLAKQEEVREGVLPTSLVKAFRVPAGVPVEVYSTTLHYAPCHLDPESGFRVAVVLPRGTNTEKPEIEPASFEDRLLWARNKWLIAHQDTKEAARGAYVGLVGENIDISE